MSEIITIDPRRIKAERAACINFTTEELEAGLPEKHREAERIWETTLMEAIGADGPKSVTEAINTLKLQRDTAWRELREIREAIKADENESTADEVRSLVAKFDIARRTLEDHGPKGHNVTNQQYVDLRASFIEVVTALLELEKITSRHVQWTARGKELRSLHERLEKFEVVVNKYKGPAPTTAGKVGE